MTTKAYRSLSVDLNRAEAHEPLISVAEYGVSVCPYYARADGLNIPYCRPFKNAINDVLVRQGVLERLLLANQLLKADGAELLVLDGFRSIELQFELWQYFVNQARHLNSQLSETDCEEFAQQYCSDPRGFELNDSKTWPTHCTGGAVDVTLRDLGTKQQLFMGSDFDQAALISATAHFEQTEPDCRSKMVARENRRLLYWAMKEAGFANYAFEWWHFDYLNQMWKLNADKTDCPPCYGPAVLPNGSF